MKPLGVPKRLCGEQEGRRNLSTSKTRKSSGAGPGVAETRGPFWMRGSSEIQPVGVCGQSAWSPAKLPPVSLLWPLSASHHSPLLLLTPFLPKSLFINLIFEQVIHLHGSNKIYLFNSPHLPISQTLTGHHCYKFLGYPSRVSSCIYKQNAYIILLLLSAQGSVP